jgi:FkbM family methyltransferase
MKKIIRKLLQSVGWDLVKWSPPVPVLPGSDKRPVGNMRTLLEDLKYRGLHADWILDVGANATTWSNLALQVFPSSKVFMIEPQLEMEARLQEFSRNHAGSSYILAGAGAQKGLLTLTVWDDLAGSSLLPNADPELVKAGKQREIPIVTIDQLIEEGKIAIPQIIKLDIQGFELEALKGATKTFGVTEAYIMETSLIPFADVPGMPVLAEVISFMKDRGYEVYDFGGFLRRPLDGALAQCDICFVRSNGMFRKSNNWN